MTRLVFFVLTVASLLAVYALNSYKSTPHNNDSFSFDEARVAHIKHLKMVETLAAATHPKEDLVAEVVKEKIPAVVLDTEELKNGAKVYKKCVVCHGKFGSGKKSQKAPKISGQYDWYLETQIIAMKSGKRINKVMNPYIKNLSRKDVKDVSTYIAKLPW